MQRHEVCIKTAWMNIETIILVNSKCIELANLEKQVFSGTGHLTLRTVNWKSAMTFIVSYITVLQFNYDKQSFKYTKITIVCTTQMRKLQGIWHILQ